MAVGDGYSGTIVSGGPGPSYTANLVGLGNTPVVCQQLHASETIPAGSGILAVQTTLGFRFQIPVWVEAP